MRTTRRLFFSCYLLLVTGGLRAQVLMPLPDDQSLLNPVYFDNHETGELVYNAYWAVQNEQPQADSLIQRALRLNKNKPDPKVDMACYMLLGYAQYRRGEFKKALDFFNKSLSYDNKVNPHTPVRERTMKIIGNCYSDLGAKNMALNMYREVIHICEQRDKIPSVRLYHHYCDFAGVFMATNQPDSNVYYLKKAIHAAARFDNLLWMASGLNNLGYKYIELQQYDSALASLERAQRVLPLNDKSDSLFLGSIADNMAIVYEKKGLTQEALRLYGENYNRFKNTIEVGRFLHAGNAQIRLFTRLGKHADAGKLLKEMIAFAANSQVKLPENMLDELMHAELEFARATGNDFRAVQISELLRKKSDSLLKIANEKKFTAMDFLLEEKSANLKTQLQLESLAREEEKNRASYDRMLRYSIITISVISIFLLVVLFRKRVTKVKSLTEDQTILRQLAELRLMKEQLDKEKLNKELDFKRRDLTDMAVNISSRKKLTDEWLEKLKKVKASKDPEQELQLLIMQLKNQEQSSEEKRLLPQHIEQVNQEFYEKLKTAYPDLTKMETGLCGMIRMRLPIKEIAGIRNISSHAVRVAKHRLKKKMNLGIEQDLDQFINSI